MEIEYIQSKNSNFHFRTLFINTFEFNDFQISYRGRDFE